MKKNKLFLLGMLAALLTFNLVLAGCDNPAGSDDDDDDNTSGNKQTWTVTFDVNDGTPAAQPLEIPKGGKINRTPTTPTKDGFVFDAWCTDQGGTTKWDFSSAVTGDMTLYAGWTEVPAGSFAVTFEANGGSSVSGQVKKSGDKITAVTTTRDGYDFVAWYKEAAFTTQWNFTTDTVTGNITLYAKWTAKSYTITYVLNDGTNAANAPASYTAEDAVTLPTPTRTGYTFGGWYANAGLSGSAVTEIPKGSAENKTFYAKWTADSKGGDDAFKGTWVSDDNFVRLEASDGSFKQYLVSNSKEVVRGTYTVSGNTVTVNMTQINTVMFGGADTWVSWADLSSEYREYIGGSETWQITIVGNSFTSGDTTLTKQDGTTGGGNTDPKTLVITDIPANLAALGQEGIQIAIVEAGKTLQGQSDATAGADGSTTQTSGSGPYTATASLYAAPNYSSRWTGSGKYDVYLLLGKDYSTRYQLKNVTFSSATTTVSATSFSSW
ncbi:MAG: InlB B-repeat-containing protein [Treponema sp.]|jgi:uncharacterized repeat protein (TIGR02543 family)|nr:InlB B-repeat-containing protein [Treponema sp.]